MAPDSLSSAAMPARDSRGRSRGPGPVQKTAGQTADVAAGGQRQCLMTLPLPRVSGLESGSAMIMDTERLGWERRQEGRLHSRVALWMVRSSGPGYCSQVAGWRKCHLTTPGLVEPQELPIASRWCRRHRAENAPFPLLAEMLTAQPYQGMADRVSLVPFACSVLEGADDSRHVLQANGTRPTKQRS